MSVSWRERLFFLLAATCLLLLTLPSPAYALLPPDVIFSLGSQAAQLYAIAGAIVLSMLATLSTTITLLLQNRVVKLVLFFLIALVILWVWSVGLLALYRPGTVTPVTTTPSAVIGYRYYSDRFVFVGKRPNGDPIAFDLFVNRREVPDGGFIHYDIFDATDKNEPVHADTSLVAPGYDIVPDNLLPDFQRSVAKDHSSRESFTFTIRNAGVEYKVVTEELKGDFITKNEPDNTEYVSVGSALLITTGGESIAGNILYQRIYSTDYRSTIFFAGFDTLKSNSTQLILWNNAGGFYMADASTVYSTTTAYSSHFWSLTKDTSGARKAFSGSMARQRRQRLHRCNSRPWDFKHPRRDKTTVQCGVHRWLW
jgi:hypothetical protein